MYLTLEGWWLQIQDWNISNRRERGRRREREVVCGCVLAFACACVCFNSVHAYTESKIHLVSGTERAGKIVKMIIFNLLIIFLMAHW